MREAIKQDLLDQLERNGTVGKFYTDLIEDYMSLYDTKTALIADIRERGVKVPIRLASGVVKDMKTNDSVADLLKVNAQMLKIAAALGLDPARSDGDGDDPDDERNQL